MNILVCIKQVPDDTVEINVKDGHANLEGVETVVNAFDTYALEMAVRLKEEKGGEVTVVSIGDESVKNSLKNCLAVGADKAFHVVHENYKDLDPAEIAEILKATKEELEKENKFDIVFCGKETTDFIASQVGILLAEKLNVPVMTNIIDIKVEDEKVEAKQEDDAGYRILEANLPLVLTINKPEYDPRYPTIKSKMAARRKEIPDLELNVETSKDLEVVEEFAPQKREAGVKIQEESIEETVQKAIEIIIAKKAL